MPYQVFRGPTSTTPLADGQLGFNTTTKVLYVGLSGTNYAINAAGTPGTVTSVALAVPTGLGVTGSPITTAGTITITTSLNGVIVGDGSGFSAVSQVPLDKGGTGANLSDPNADRILFWDDSAGQVTWLTVAAPLSISGTTLSASGVVTSVAVTVPTGMSVSGSPITTSGTIAITLSVSDGVLKASGGAIVSETPLSIGDGGTGAALTDPGGDVLWFWDESANSIAWLNFAGGGLFISGVSMGVDASLISNGTLALARGGTGASLSDPNADRILFWDDSAGQVTWLTAGAGLTITSTTITADAADFSTLSATDVALNDYAPIYDTSASANKKLSIDRLGGFLHPGLTEGRLTLSTGVPVTTSDVTAATMLYFSPLETGNRVCLYDLTRWIEFALSELQVYLTVTAFCHTENTSTTISGVGVVEALVRGMQVTGTGIPANSTISTIPTANTITINNAATATGDVTLTFKLPPDKNYDVFAFIRSGVPFAQLGNAWSSSTARTDALGLQDRVTVNNAAINSADYNTIAAKEGKYLGTIRTTATAGQCEDSVSKRFCWNLYNRGVRPLFTCPAYNNNNAVTSYTTTSTTYTEANGGTGSKLEFVLGLSLDAVDYIANGNAGNSTGSALTWIGVGEDSATSATVAGYMQAFAATASNSFATGKKTLFGIGYHYLDLLIAVGSGTGTYYADMQRNGSSADPYGTALRAEVLG